MTPGPVANVLSEEKKQQVLGLGRLGWPLRRIEEATGIRRETASRYLKAAGISIRSPGGWGRGPPPKRPKKRLPTPRGSAGAKPAKEVHTDSGPDKRSKTGQRAMREMGRVVETFVHEPATLERITTGWLTIRVSSAA